MAHYRNDHPVRTMAPVPKTDVTPSIGQQLADALRESGVSARELARRLAEADDTKPESKRRWLQKLLRDKVDRPSLREVEVALGKPAGFFVLPTPEEKKRGSDLLEDLRARVAEVEKTIEYLESQVRTLADDRLTVAGPAARPAAAEELEAAQQALRSAPLADSERPARDARGKSS